jgi:hypothetical protein
MNETGYYPSFALPSWFHEPETLRLLLADLWSHCYPDLYEEDCDDPLDLAVAVARVLDALWPEGDDLGHRRLVCMALVFCRAVEPTVSGHLPGDLRAGQVIARLEAWLDDPEAPSDIDATALFPEVITPPLALNEALIVLRQGLAALDASRARRMVQEILDDCLEGYAIFPGSAGRRDLFNWWLVEVVPAAWSLREPDAIYTMRWPWPLALAGDGAKPA